MTTCENCGASFAPKRPTYPSRYCGNPCRMQAWRKDNPLRWKELAAESYQRHAAKRRAKQTEYRQANIEERRAADRAYMKKRGRPYADPEKVKAQNAVNYAIASGRLEPQPCEGCGSESYATHDGRRGVHAYYDDYSKPLDVRWLCYSCHGKEHRRYV